MREDGFVGLLNDQLRSALIALIDERVAHCIHTAARPAPQLPWLTVAEAAAVLRTTPAAIYKRIERGQLRSYRPDGSRLLIRVEDVEPVDAK